MSINILLAGVGGQGLVLTTKIICEAAFKQGYDVKSNDVVGLSQRGGKVWGSVKIGEKIYSPNILPGHGDFLIGLEPLEGLRLSYLMREKGTIILNKKIIPPVPVIFEKEIYPINLYDSLKEKFNVISIDATQEGIKMGSEKVANTILIGMLAKKIDIPNDVWYLAIKENVPTKFIDMNIKAFEFGLTNFR